ncbi:MAG: host attachment protein [Planctomycetes bacterium]|nr:host attachment protein [Planctomycetota bacterium]
MAQTIDWILVADRCKARILQSPQDSNGHFSVAAAFIHPAGKLHRGQTESDAPGRFSLQGNARTASEPHEDPDHHEARKFAGELCDHLERGSEQGLFDRLIVVCPPRFLGVLRERMSPRLQSRVAGEFNQELTHLSDSQLQSHVVQFLSAISTSNPIRS